MALSPELSRRFTGLTLATVVALAGSTACEPLKSVGGSSEKTTQTDCSARLAAFTLVGKAAEGGENAINNGKCVPVYAHQNYDEVTGNIQPKESFTIECFINSPPSAYVRASAEAGFVHVSEGALKQIHALGAHALPPCSQVLS